MHINLVHSNLMHINLVHSNLMHINIVHSNLIDINLVHSNLMHINLVHNNLMLRPKKKYICEFQVSALKNLGMVSRHNILFYWNILYRNFTFQVIFFHFSANMTIFCSQFTIKRLRSEQKPRKGWETWNTHTICFGLINLCSNNCCTSIWSLHNKHTIYYINWWHN